MPSLRVVVKSPCAAGRGSGPGIGISGPHCEPAEAATQSTEKFRARDGASQEPMMKAFAYGEGATLRREHDAENRKRSSDEHSARSCNLRGSIRARGRRWRRRCRRCWRSRGWLIIIRRWRKQWEHGPDESGYCGQRDIWSRCRRHVGNIRNHWCWQCPIRFGRFGVRDTGHVGQFR
jgi:hypothetical protein